MSAGRSRAGAAGFTLIEILLAMLIFLSGVAGIYALLSTGLGLQQQGLDLAALGRRLEEVVVVLEQQVAQGRHFDTDEQAWIDIASAQLEDGTFYSVVFVPEEGNEAEGTLLALVRVARDAKGLARARPVGWVLTPGPDLVTAVRDYKARRANPTAEPEPP